MAALRLMIAHDDGRIAGREGCGEARRRKAAVGMDLDLEPVEWIVGGIGNDLRHDAGNCLQCVEPQIERLAFALADSRMIALLPGFERRHDARNALLAHLHAAADAAILQIRSAHQILAPGDNAGGGTAEEFVARIDDDIGALGQEPLQIIFGRGIDDDRHVLGAADRGEVFERNHAVLHGVMRHDIEGCRGALVDRIVELIAVAAADRADWYYRRACKPDRLFDRCAVVDDMPDLDQHLGLEAGGIVGQAFDRQQVITRHGARDGKRNPAGAGGGHEARLRSRQSRNDAACLAMQCIDFDELRRNGRHRGDRLWHDDRGTERRHGA